MLRLLVLLVLCSALAAADTLICIGDSLTAGLGVEEDEAYPALLQGLVDADHLPVTVVNAGLSGDTSTTALTRIDWLLKAKPRIALLCIGANDGLQGVDIAITAKNLDQIISKLQDAKVTVVLAGMQLPSNFNADYRGKFAAIFPDAASRNHVAFMPFLLDGVAIDPSKNQADGIHPNPAGHAIIAKNVYAFLKPLLSAPAN